MKLTTSFPSRVTAVIATALMLAAPVFAGEVVVVSAKSTVGAMTTDQVSQLFLGKSPTLPGGAAAVLIDQPEGSAARESFYMKATGKNAAQMKALWSRLIFSGAAQAPKAVGNDAEVKKAVAETAGAIGYIDKGAVDGSVKVVLTLD